MKFSIEEQEWVMVLTDNGQKPEKTSKKAEGYPVYEKGWSNVEAA